MNGDHHLKNFAIRSGAKTIDVQFNDDNYDDVVQARVLYGRLDIATQNRLK